jgi:hypothetical protein
MQVLQPADRPGDGGRIGVGGTNDLLSAFRKLRGELIPVSRHQGYLPQPLSGSTRPAIANPAANAVTGRSLAARTKLGAQLRAGGIS